MDGEFLTVKPAAAELHPESASVYHLLKIGELACRRVGLRRGKILIDVAEVRRYWDASSEPVWPASTMRRYGERRERLKGPSGHDSVE